MIYLDNGATTFPKPECVWDAVDHFNRTAAVNAGRGAYQAARDATAMIREVREQLISLCDAREQAQVILTPSVTIALNQIIRDRNGRQNRWPMSSPYEHNAVLRPLKLLEKRVGIRVRSCPSPQIFPSTWRPRKKCSGRPHRILSASPPSAM